MKFWFFILLFWAPVSWATQFVSCPSSDNPVTSPAPVNVAELQQKIHALKDESGKAFSPSPSFDEKIKNAFDTANIKTKMEQFYTMLWLISEELNAQKIKNVSFTARTMQEVLLSSKVFTDASIPSRIQTIRFRRTEGGAAECTVQFANANIEVPLNQGDGFYLFRNGKCQHAQKLVFDKIFSFQMKKNLGNMMVTDFKGVDLFGDFGNRGFVDVDIQYVSLQSVEFLGGTVNGRVTAYVSREEFKKNEHNALLQWVTKFVPDRSVQPIDW